MKRGYQGLFCMIIAIVILFSGMCLESIQTHSYLGYTQLSAVTISDSQGTETPLEESCTLQMIRGKKASSKENFAEQISKKREIKELALFLCAIILTYHFIEIREMDRILQLPAKRSEGIISCYIHNQDGKKRISHV